MPNSLLKKNQSNPRNSLADAVGSLRSKGPSQSVFMQEYGSNLEFRRFADSLKNMSPQQAFSRFGLDFNQFKNLKW